METETIKKYGVKRLFVTDFDEFSINATLSDFKSTYPYYDVINITTRGNTEILVFYSYTETEVREDTENLKAQISELKEQITQLEEQAGKHKNHVTQLTAEGNMWKANSIAKESQHNKFVNDLILALSIRGISNEASILYVAKNLSEKYTKLVHGLYHSLNPLLGSINKCPCGYCDE